MRSVPSNGGLDSLMWGLPLHVVSVLRSLMMYFWTYRMLSECARMFHLHVWWDPKFSSVNTCIHWTSSTNKDWASVEQVVEIFSLLHSIVHSKIANWKSSFLRIKWSRNWILSLLFTFVLLYYIYLFPHWDFGKQRSNCMGDNEIV